jgi:hypothetical protein
MSDGRSRRQISIDRWSVASRAGASIDPQSPELRGKGPSSTYSKISYCTDRRVPSHFERRPPPPPPPRRRELYFTMDGVIIDEGGHPWRQKACSAGHGATASLDWLWTGRRGRTKLGRVDGDAITRSRDSRAWGWNQSSCPSARILGPGVNNVQRQRENLQAQPREAPEVIGPGLQRRVTPTPYSCVGASLRERRRTLSPPTDRRWRWSWSESPARSITDQQPRGARLMPRSGLPSRPSEGARCLRVRLGKGDVRPLAGAGTNPSRRYCACPLGLGAKQDARAQGLSGSIIDRRTRNICRQAMAGVTSLVRADVFRAGLPQPGGRRRQWRGGTVPRTVCTVQSTVPGWGSPRPVRMDTARSTQYAARSSNVEAACGPCCASGPAARR